MTDLREKVAEKEAAHDALAPWVEKYIAHLQELFGDTDDGAVYLELQEAKRALSEHRMQKLADMGQAWDAAPTPGERLTAERDALASTVKAARATFIRSGWSENSVAVASCDDALAKLEKSNE